MAENKNNTWLWVIIIVIIIVLAFLVLRSRQDAGVETGMPVPGTDTVDTVVEPEGNTVPVGDSSTEDAAACGPAAPKTE